VAPVVEADDATVRASPLSWCSNMAGVWPHAGSITSGGTVRSEGTVS
jgi:hypothetical protein